MGNHRAERRTTRDGPSETLAPPAGTAYVGRRVAGRAAAPEVVPIASADATYAFDDVHATAERPLVTAPTTPGMFLQFVRKSV